VEGLHYPLHRPMVCANSRGNMVFYVTESPQGEVRRPGSAVAILDEVRTQLTHINTKPYTAVQVEVIIT
jgi:hypothetical protein